MAWVKKATLVWRGDFGRPKSNYSQSTISGVIGTTELITLSTALAAHSDCNLAKHAMIWTEQKTDSEPGTNANIDRKAVIYFRNPTTLKVHSVAIPEIVAADIEATPEGIRVTDSAVATIVGLISAATGISYTGLYGVVVQRR